MRRRRTSGNEAAPAKSGAARFFVGAAVDVAANE